MGVNLGAERLTVLVEPDIELVEGVALNTDEQAALRLRRCLPWDVTVYDAEYSALHVPGPDNEQLEASGPSPTEVLLCAARHCARDDEAPNMLEGQLGTSFCVKPATWGTRFTP
ncbi:MAG: hypothetical protein JWQ18_1318 [Conexibacter sp.]|nr:hypothetical protein [Conexibacter sp.]